MNNEKEQLIIDIREFLEEYAKISADYVPKYDDYNERFNGPDSDCLNASALQLENLGYISNPIFSEYRQGCYNLSKEKGKKGEEIHDSLIERAKAFYKSEPTIKI